VCGFLSLLSFPSGYFNAVTQLIGTDIRSGKASKVGHFISLLHQVHLVQRPIDLHMKDKEAGTKDSGH
jgi:hypothetical protein